MNKMSMKKTYVYTTKKIPKYDRTEKLFEKLPAKEEDKDYEVIDKLPSGKKKKKNQNALLRMAGEE